MSQQSHQDREQNGSEATSEAAQGAGEREHGPEPRDSGAQASPEPERRETVQESMGQAVHQQEDPPQAEGAREDVEPAGEDVDRDPQGGPGRRH